VSRDEAREHIRAAQEAEIAGNREAAVRHLERAGLAFLRVGLHARAAQMYQNCLRLAPERDDLRQALAKAEAWSAPRIDAPPEMPLGPPVVSAEGFDALAIPRGPQPMIPGLDAWCSFCCRPTAEAGELVAGPAGAFICAECVGQSGALLGAEEPSKNRRRFGAAPGEPSAASSAESDFSTSSEAVAPAPRAGADDPLAPGTRPVRAGALFFGAPWVLEAARAAVQGKGRPVVLAGPEGSGKTALLAALGAEDPALHPVDLARAEPIPAFGGLLVEHLDQASPTQRAQLRDRAFVATWRAEPGLDALQFVLGDALLTLPVAPGFALPPELPPAVVLAMAPPDAEVLGMICDRELAEHGGPMVSQSLVSLLIQRAISSGRGAKGLVAEVGLLRRLPSDLDATTPPKPRRPRRKKS